MRIRKRKQRKVRSASRKPRRLAVQPLEARRLMAADIGLVEGWIHVQGTDQSDIVESYMDGGQIVVSASMRDGSGATVDKADATFDATQVQGIFFEGHAGDDVFVNDADLPVVARGGAGNDTLLGSSASDVLTGGDGDDFLAAGAAGTILLGGAGDNVMFDIEPEAVAEPLAPAGESATLDGESDTADEGVCLDTPEWASESLVSESDAQSTDSSEQAIAPQDQPVDAQDQSGDEESAADESAAEESSIGQTDDEPECDGTESTVEQSGGEESPSDGVAEATSEPETPIENAADPGSEELVPIDVADELPSDLPGESMVEAGSEEDAASGDADTPCDDSVESVADAAAEESASDATSETDSSDPAEPAELTGDSSDSVADATSADNPEETDEAELDVADIAPQPPTDNDFIVGGWGDDQIFGGDGDDWLVGYQLDDAALSDVLFGVLDAIAQQS